VVSDNLGAALPFVIGREVNYSAWVGVLCVYMCVCWLLVCLLASRVAQMIIIIIIIIIIDIVVY